MLEGCCFEGELRSDELARFHTLPEDVSYLQQLVANADSVAKRCAALYRFLGCSRLAQLVEILQSNVDKRLLPPNLHLFWEPATYRVSSLIMLKDNPFWNYTTKI